MEKSSRWCTGQFSGVRLVARSLVVALFLIILTLGEIIRTRYGSSSSPSLVRDVNSREKSNLSPKKLDGGRRRIDIPLNCSLGANCPANYYPSSILVEDRDNRSVTPPPFCPNYFRWIHEDLWPWRETGITEEMVMSARPSAQFRLVVVDGKAYVETYERPYQSRDVLTQWGILQLLRRYPGKIPDLDLMFNCDDLPLIMKDKFPVPPPPIFAFAGDDLSLDIVFPDWSFWGWPEINTKPWELIVKELEEGNNRRLWKQRDPYAYWKGNPEVAVSRRDLLKCNVSDKRDWNARVYINDWNKEREEGFKNSDLASQCIHRYKIYVEGCSWSVSLKYILACDSMALLINPKFYDFFTRGLVPLKHYWPVKDYDKCKSIKHAVDWGNSHLDLAQGIAEAGSSYILDDVKMDYVYDYMFHLLTEYGKLLKYKPNVPSDAVELCSEAIACPAEGFHRKCMIDSLVKGPSLSEPCTMPPPYDPASLRSVIQTKDNRIKQVDIWEFEYWQNQTGKSRT